MTAFPGMCRVNHAEVMKYKGRLTEAQELADRASAGAARLEPADRGRGVLRARRGPPPARRAGAGRAGLPRGGRARAHPRARPLAPPARPGEREGRARVDPPRGRQRLARACRRRRACCRPRSRSRSPPASPNEAAEYAERFGLLAETYDTSALHATAAFTRGQVALARGDADDAYQRVPPGADDLGLERRHLRRRPRARAARESAQRRAATRRRRSGSCRRPPRASSASGAVRDADRVAELLMRDTSTEVLKTFLFTDIVGSTEIASAVESDRHWVSLLRRHDDALRAIFADFNGPGRRPHGDGFFAAFEEAEDARRRRGRDPAGDRPGLRVRHPHRRPHGRRAADARELPRQGRPRRRPHRRRGRRAGRSWRARRRSASSRSSRSRARARSR